MNLLCWNIRGARGASKQGVVRKIVSEKGILFLSLVKTKSSYLNDHIIQNF